MQVQVRYFAAARETTGLETEALELPVGTTVGGAFDLLAARHPGLDALRTSLRFAVGSAFQDDTAPLAEGDTLALIPPVGGG